MSRGQSHPGGGSAECTVTDKDDKPVAGAVVVLVPARRERLSLYENCVTDEDGRCRINGIAPGDDKAFAWEADREFNRLDPESFKDIEEHGKAVKVDPQGKVRVELKPVPAEAGN